jgi:Xaa-Pro aminopeptidase
MFDYVQRQRRLDERLEEAGVDALLLAPSSDLEYLFGVERQIPNFGEVVQAHGWISGALIRRNADPVFFFPRMLVDFHMHSLPDGEVIIVNESDDGPAIFARVVSSVAGSGIVGVGDRIWAETLLQLGGILGFDRVRTASYLVNELRRIKTHDELAAMGRAIDAVEQAMAKVAPLVVPGVSMLDLAEAIEHEMRIAGSRCPSFTTHVYTGFGKDDVDSGTDSKRTAISEGTAVMFDFGSVVDGYCADFGRTIVCGEPPPGYVAAYEVMLTAQEAGRVAARTGAVAREVDAACRKPIEEAGLGEHFRHSMGHGIGLDVHERPLLSREDDTPLESGMTFTNEPSIMIPDRFSVRIEDIIVIEEGGGRNLNSYPPDLVANSC